MFAQADGPLGFELPEFNNMIAESPGHGIVMQLD
jgi:hypothetical protein